MPYSASTEGVKDDAPVMCPKCRRMSLLVHYMSGEFDEGRIEGALEVCTECGYEDVWGHRC